MSQLPPRERITRARIAANDRWARTGARAEQSELLRAANHRLWAERVDPDGTMPPAELEAAIRNARKAWSARLNAARRKKAAS